MIKNNLFFWGAEQLSGINQILNLISTYFVNSGSERKTISRTANKPHLIRTLMRAFCKSTLALTSQQRFIECRHDQFE